MRFVHAADLHLDSPMRGLAAYEGAPVEALRSASRVAFTNLVRDALAEQVDLVVLAGDIFDGDWPDYNTGLFFTRQLTELTRAGIKVVMVAGNHDAASQLTRRLDLPVGATMLDHRSCQTVLPDALGVDVAVHGQSYATRDLTDDLTRNYPPPVPGTFNIGVLHTALDGRPGHDPYAPCSLDALTSAGYGYWALGHVHRREVLHRAPWVVFPGNLQGRHARETGAKGYVLVTVDDREVTAVEFRAADAARWARVEVDVGGARHLHEVSDLVQAQLRAAVVEADGRLVAARVVLTGSTPVHDRLIAEHEQLEAQIRSHSYELGAMWIERIHHDTTRPGGLPLRPDRDDAMAELFGSIAMLRDDPDELMRRYGEHFAKLRDKLPYAVLHDDGVDPRRPEVLMQALEAAEARLVAALSTTGGSAT
jgi:exonuclease SbcD